MNLDKYGLPVQSNADPLDQLQRTGMILLACAIRGIQAPIEEHKLWTNLEAYPGVYKRWTEGKTNDVSADQLISAMCYYAYAGHLNRLEDMYKAMMLRHGFAQNVIDGIGTQKPIWPDLMILRAMPLMHTALPSKYSVLWQLYLIPLAVGAVIYGMLDPDNVDDNNTTMTLETCARKNPTLLARLSKWIYYRFRPKNLGSETYGLSNVSGALAWYHRPDPGSNGNPEIAALWRPITDR
jgi:hypothetical protein